MKERALTFKTWCGTREGRSLIVLLFLALVVRLALAPYRGFFQDLGAFVFWGAELDRHFWTFYSLGQHWNPQPDYPPLAMYLFGLVTKAFMSLTAGGLRGPQLSLYVATVAVDLHPKFAVAIKLPIIAADLAAVALVYALARKEHSPRWALMAAGSLAFSPVVLLEGALWGQIEMLFAVAIAAALVFATRRRGLPSGIWFGVALMLKPQPIIFAPVLLLYLWRWAGLREALRAVGGLAAAVMVTCLPYLLPPHPQMLAFFSDAATFLRVAPDASISAFNLWWLLGAQHGNAFAPVVGPFTPTMIGWAIFVVALGVGSLSIWRDSAPSRLYLTAALMVVAFYTATTLQRERYLFPAVLLLLLAAIYDTRHIWFYVVASVTTFFNMALVLIHPPYSDSRLASGALGVFVGQHPQIAQGVSLVNVVLLVAMTAMCGLLVRERRAAWTWIGASGFAAASLARTGERTGLVPTSFAQRAPRQSRRLTVVLPAYNEEAVIERTVRECLDATSDLVAAVEVIVVDDGSHDRTGAIIDRLAAADRRVRALHHELNRGYGAALLTGFAAARNDLLFFMDSDGQFDIREVERLLDMERERPGTVVLGYRRQRRDSALRRLNAWGWKQVVWLVLGLRGVRDIDCAFKLFSTSFVRACEVTAQGAMVNTELLVKLTRMRVPMVQVPVGHFPRQHGAATGANLQVIARAFWELLRLRLRMRRWDPTHALVLAGIEHADHEREDVTYAHADGER